LGVCCTSAAWASDTAGFRVADVESASVPLTADEATAAEDKPSPDSDESEDCGACADDECSCPPDAPWTLPQPCVLQQLGIKVGGWLQQGVTFNADNPRDGFNGPVATNDWDDRYQMNQLWMYLHRPADTGGCGWAVGGHVDMIYGTDFRFGQNYGLETRINGDNQDYGLVIPQAYLEVAYNDLSVKLGHFAAILDYEAVPAIANPFYSHSYSYGYTVPQLVTGVLADYKLTDQLSLQAGFHRGWFMFEDLNDELDAMAGVKWTSCDKRTSLAYAISAGAQDPPFPDWNGTPGDQDRFVYSLVLQHQLTEALKYVCVHNLGLEQNTPAGGQDAEWYGLNQYFLYAINPRWSANVRVEILRDDDGMRVAGPGNLPGVAAFAGNSFIGDFIALTCGLNWRPTPNWLVRPEVRWDWFDRDGPIGPTGLPFDGGLSDDQFTCAVDAVLTF
jgi:hypothetical protein